MWLQLYIKTNRSTKPTIRGPRYCLHNPQGGYKKAEKQQDQLTDNERALLLSRSDVVGKALAHPELLTLEECHKVLQWPSPDAISASIRRATDGVSSKLFDHFAKARNVLARQQLGSLHNKELQ